MSTELGIHTRVVASATAEGDSGDDDSDVDSDHSDDDDATHRRDAELGSRSAAGRSGVFHNFLPWISNPTFTRYTVGTPEVPADPIAAIHTFAGPPAKGTGNVDCATLIYPCGDGPRAMSRTRSKGSKWTLPNDDKPDRPRVFVERPGCAAVTPPTSRRRSPTFANPHRRRFYRRTRPQNLELQQEGSASKRRNVEIATSRVKFLCWCAYYGLAPLPGAEQAAATAAHAAAGSSDEGRQTRAATANVTEDERKQAAQATARAERLARKSAKKSASEKFGDEGVAQERGRRHASPSRRSYPLPPPPHTDCKDHVVCV